MAPVAIIAHEWGHHIHTLALPEGFTLGQELEADCYAGTYTRFAEEDRGTDPGQADQQVMFWKRRRVLRRGNPNYVEFLLVSPVGAWATGATGNRPPCSRIPVWRSVPLCALSRLPSRPSFGARAV